MIFMCLNCGCGMWDDDMGKEDNLTLTKLAKAANAENQSSRDTLKHMQDAANQISADELKSKMEEV